MRVQTRIPAFAAVFAFTGIATSATFFSFDVTLPHTFTAGSPARASEVNENFDAVKTAIEDRALEVDDAMNLITSDLSSLGTQVDDLQASVDVLPGALKNVITVSAENGDFESVPEALASITDAAADNRYLVQVGPGEFFSTELVAVPSFVELAGSGVNATVIRSSRTGNAQNDTIATVSMADKSTVRDMTVVNDGASALSSGVFGAGHSRDTLLLNVRLIVDGSGGVGHIGLMLDNVDTVVDSCEFKISGATVLNTGISVTDAQGPFSQPIIRDTTVLAEGASSGIGLSLSNANSHIEGCRIRGIQHAVKVTLSGITTIRDSRIETLALNPVYDQSGATSILSGGVRFVGGNPTGFGSQFKYTWCISNNFSPVTNGFGSNVQ